MDGGVRRSRRRARVGHAPSTSRRERPGTVMSASSVALAREKGARDEAPRRRLNWNVQVLPEILVEAQRHRCVLAGGHVDLKADAGVNAITAGEGKVLAHHGPRARRVRSKGPAQPAAPPEARRQRPRRSPPTIYERGSSIHRPSTAWGPPEHVDAEGEDRRQDAANIVVRSLHPALVGNGTCCPGAA